MHIYYRQWFESEQEYVENIGITIGEHMNTKDVQNAYLAGLENLAREYESEQTKVTDYAAKSVAFLQQEGLLVRNNALEGYQILSVLLLIKYISVSMQK